MGSVGLERGVGWFGGVVPEHRTVPNLSFVFLEGSVGLEDGSAGLEGSSLSIARFRFCFILLSLLPQ